MFPRALKVRPARSFFLFGARGVGKYTFIKKQWGIEHHYINLLLDQWERRYSQSPDLLINDVAALNPKIKWVVIDEIQKVPKLLDVVHEIIESSSLKFVLTGSSARKLKRAGSNLLAGRASHHQMFPLTHRELGSKFNLQDALQWGTLPSIIHLDKEDRIDYLKAYCITYLKEEILQEQIVRNSLAFRNFLEVAAQENRETLNFSKIAKDVGADHKTIQSFFQILEDTLIGTFVNAYTKSARKSVKLQPKFYLFDLGIKRALGQSLDNTLISGSPEYGAAFEHFIVTETIRLNHYTQKDYQISHYQTSAGGEIDLILSRNKEVIAVEIKSSNHAHPSDAAKLARIAAPLKPTSLFLVSQDKVSSRAGEDGNVQCEHWESFFDKVFGV
ncbi:AAA family ATPase [Bdellovibrionota bacterium FG-2]